MVLELEFLKFGPHVAIVTFVLFLPCSYIASFW